MSYVLTHNKRVGISMKINILKMCAICAIVVAMSATSSCKTDNPLVPDQLTQNQALWQNKNIKDYSYQIKVTWFSPNIYPVIITVSDGIATSKVSEQENHGITISMVNGLDTLDKVFIKLQETYLEKPNAIEVSYDSTYGFPTRVMVDPQANVLDEWWGFDITNFTPKVG